MIEEHGEMDDLAAVLNLIRNISHSGKSAWLVGGAVRDIVLGTLPYDWDIVIKTDLEGINALFPDAVCVGRDRNLVCHTSFHGLKLEISTLHGEDIVSDLAGRDFTINAMAMDPEGELIDLFGGVNDLKNDLLRFTPPAMDRIREDPVRVVRMCRFASTRGLKILSEDSCTVKNYSSAICAVSSERIGKEVLKALDGRPATFFDLVEEHSLTGLFFPFLEAMKGKRVQGCTEKDLDRYCHVMEILSELQRLKKSPDLAAAALLFYVYSQGVLECLSPDKARDILYSWAWPSGRQRRILNMVRNLFLLNNTMGIDNIVRLYFQLDKNTLDELFDLTDIFTSTGRISAERYRDNRKKIENAFQELKSSRFLLGGGEIRDLFGLDEGPVIGIIQRILFQEVAKGKIKDNKDVLEILSDELIRLEKS